MTGLPGVFTFEITRCSQSVGDQDEGAGSEKCK